MSEAPLEKARVLVVGAGLSGLAAAWDLRRRGFDVVVLEAAERSGGRAGAQVEDGFVIERAIHTLAPRDDHLVEWIRGLELQGSLLPPRRIELAQVRGHQIERIEPGSIAGRTRIAGVKLRDALRTLRLPRLMARYRRQGHLDLEAPERAARWDDRSAADFARLYFGPSAFENWVEPALCGSYGSDAHETSRVAFLLQLQAGLESGLAYGVPREPLARLVDRAAEVLEVRHGHRVERIEAAGAGYRVHLQHAGVSGIEEAEAVVLTPAVDETARVAVPVLVPAERDFLLDASYAPSAVLTVGMEGPLAGPTRFVRVPKGERSPIDAVLIDPMGEGRAPHGSAHVVASATERFALSHAGAADDVLQKSLCDALSRILPEVAARRVFSRVVRRAQGVPHFQVGAYRNLARFAAVQNDQRAGGRRVYFAGDYLAGPRAENSVAAGFRAAAALAADLA